MNLSKINNLKIKIYLDGADIDLAKSCENNDNIKGFTSNPSLMQKSGIQSYEQFINSFLQITNKPVSFEVTADDLGSMEKQAEKISSFGSNIHVKIPVTNTKGESTIKIIKNLTAKKIMLNITAIFTEKQLEEIISQVDPENEIILSIFAGRIADAGINPDNTFIKARQLIEKYKKYKFMLLWASVREVFNIYQAENVGADIITVTGDILKKVNLRGKDLNDYSIETVKMFYEDALKGNLKI